MNKPPWQKRDLDDWDDQVTSDWMTYAQEAQTSYCRNLNAHEKGARYTEDLFHKIDELVLMHAFGAAAIDGAPRSDLKKNFSPAQCDAAEKVRKQILKYGKSANPKSRGSMVSVQVISVTLLLVDCPQAADTSPQKKLPGLAQVAVFRVTKPNREFCFIDHTARYYADWDDYLMSNKLPRTKMCFPRNGVYKYERVSSSDTDKNNNSHPFGLDLVLAESKSCSTWERVKQTTLEVASKLGAVAGVVAIIAIPFTSGASIGVYAGYAAVVAGWVSFGCMVIGTMATLGSLWDKYWHDESYTTELLSLAMVALSYGVAKYSASVLSKVRGGVPVTRMELAFMTVLNCVRFGVDSVVFVTNCVRLVMKANEVGLKNITATEWLHFSMSAYFFGKTVFEPKTGYGIIKAAQERYLMNEKRATIKEEGAQKKYDKLVDPKERFGDGGKMQGVKDDWKGLTCSQEVCDELNRNAALIRNVNSISDLNQFFLMVSDTRTSLTMTDDGKISINGNEGMSTGNCEVFLSMHPASRVRRGRLLGGSSACPIETMTMTECTVDEQPNFSNDETLSKQPVYKPSGYGKMKVKDMRGGSTLQPTKVTSKPVPEPQPTSTTTTTTDSWMKPTVTNTRETQANVQQSTSSTTAQVNSTLWATNELAKRPKTSPGATSEEDSQNNCICQSVKISVLYANMRSINPNNPKLAEKIDRLRQLVAIKLPQLIAIVETWLKPNQRTEQVLTSLHLPGEYEIFRQDRRDGHDSRNAYGHEGRPQQAARGGGVLVLWRRGTFPNITFKRSLNEDFADNIVNFDLKCTFNCAKCHHATRTKKFIFTVVYRRPSPSGNEDPKAFEVSNDDIVNRLVHLNLSYDDFLLGYSGIAMVGDFNWRDVNKLEQITDGSDCERMSLSSDATHTGGAALDQVFSSPGFVTNSVIENLALVEVADFVSDHAPLVFSLYLGKDRKPGEECKSLRCF